MGTPQKRVGDGMDEAMNGGASFIDVRGARVHNLRNVSLRIPHDRITALCGVSGSGKSSLAFDTLFAEGRRRYLESLPSRAAGALENLDRPDVDYIEGLAPAIAVAQGDSPPGPRAILATEADLFDPVRLLFAHLGTAHCPSCGRVVRAVSPGSLAERLLREPEGTRVMVLSPVFSRGGGAMGAGSTNENGEETARRAREAFDETARAGFVRVQIDGETLAIGDVSPERLESAREIHAVVDRIVVREGARARLVDSVELAMGRSGGEIRIVLWPPDGSTSRTVNESSRFHCPDCGISLPKLEPARFSFFSRSGACPKCEGIGTDASGRVCRACGGSRLRPEVAACRLPLPGEEAPGPNMPELLSMPASALVEWAKRAQSAFASDSAGAGSVAAALLPGLRLRLEFLEKAGVGYLAPWRPAATLSGGELRRVRLAAALGRRLGGVLYVLDEPSAGLHPSDALRLVPLLRELRDCGNTVIVVEHDESIIRAADNVVEFGPGAGRNGGKIVFEGTADRWAAERLGAARQTVPRQVAPRQTSSRRRPGGGRIVVRGARAHNLAGVEVEFPKGAFTVVTGVSGAGKTSLVRDVLGASLAAGRAVGCDAVKGAESIRRVVEAGRALRVRNPRSAVVSACGAYDALRSLFAATPLAKARGYGPSRFSFNTRGGRCEACKGEGRLRLGMSFLPDVVVPCEECGGRRFNRETLEVHWAGRSIADVFDLPVAEAAEVFAAVPRLARVFATLRDAGLGHLALGQETSTLSGGELQRLFLSAELARPGRGFGGVPPDATIYLLDEPGAGQHARDLANLLQVLLRLRDAGGTIVAVEHHPLAVAAADWVIDLGPGAGAAGGRVIAQGTPDDIRACPESKMAPFLADLLPSPSGPPSDFAARERRSFSMNDDNQRESGDNDPAR